MGEYLETPEAQTALVEWIDAGAHESEWPKAKSVLDEHCIHCHNPEGVQGIVRLETYRSVSRLATLPPAARRPLLAPAAVLLVAVVGVVIYGRRHRASRS